MKVENPWDVLGKNVFNTHLKQDEIDPRSADNILIAWPPILYTFQSEFPKPQGTRVLDFGCGTGGFCAKLSRLGYDVVGVDSSLGMIESARKNSPKIIHYAVGNENDVNSLGMFDAVTSIMTVQFIKNMDNVMKLLSRVLRPSGLLTFVTFNPTWVKESILRNLWFEDFDSNDRPKEGYLTALNKLRIPVYIRDSREYDKVAEKHGLRNISEEYPEFTREFKKQYPEYIPNTIPEYLILTYRKS